MASRCIVVIPPNALFGAFVIVFPDPICGEVPNLVAIAPQVLRSPFVSDLPIESLEKRLPSRGTGQQALEIREMTNPDRTADAVVR